MIRKEFHETLPLERDAPFELFLWTKQAMIATRTPKAATPPTTQSAIKPGLAEKWRSMEIESHINIWFKQEKHLINKTGAG